MGSEERKQREEVPKMHEDAKTDKSCIFCSIAFARGKGKLYGDEDPYFMVLADMHPVSDGHMLVVPKYHAEQLDALPEMYASRVIPLIQKIVARCPEFRAYNILQNNVNMQSVNHVHFHIIPVDGDACRLNVSWETKEQAQELIEDLRRRLSTM